MKEIFYKRPIICEEAQVDGKKKLFISGTAIEVGMSRNKVQYTAEELQAAASTLIGTPVLLNHGDTDVRNIVGKVVDAKYENGIVPFKASLDEDETTIVNKIKKGLINSVSIGANYKELKVDDEGVKHPKGLEFMELSLVPIPGIKSASISQVIEEQFILEKQEAEKMESKKLQEEIEKLKKEKEELTTKNDELLSRVPDEDTEDSGDEPEQEEEKPDEEKPDEEKPEENSKIKKLEEEMANLRKKLEENKGIVETGENKGETKLEMVYEKSDVSGRVDFHPANAQELY